MHPSHRHPGDHLESALLRRAGVRHAFFTRLGGVSTGDFASLNASASTGDSPAHVRENLERAARAIGVTREQLFLVTQVHGVRVVEVGARDDREAIATTRADALWSARPGIALGVRTADCVPVLIAATDAGLVSAVHAGWRGVELGVVARAVGELERAGATPDAMLAAIGPHIGVEAFEVGEDVAERLARCSPAQNVVRRHHGGKPHVDLARIVEAQLRAAGLEPFHVERVSGCTYSEPKRFHSHRRDGARSGRLLSAIATPPAAAPPS